MMLKAKLYDLMFGWLDLMEIGPYFSPF